MGLVLRPEIIRSAGAGMRIARALAALLVLALGMAACGSSGETTSQAAATTGTAPTRTVTIWVDVPLAGMAAEEGRQMLDGARLVVAQANSRVGDIGVQVRASDDADPATGHSDAARCLAGATRAADDRTAIAVIGTYESPCTAVALPTLAAAGLALVSPVNSDPLLAAAGGRAPRVLVRLAPSDAAQGTAAAAEAKALELHRLYVLGGLSARARRMQKALAAAAPSHQLAIVGTEPIPRSVGAASSLVARIRTARADSVWIGGGAGPGVVAVLRALALPLAHTKSEPPPLAVLGSDSLYRDGLLGAAGVAADGIHLTSGFVPPDALSGEGAQFVDAFARQFGQPGLYVAYAADAARLVLDALRRSDASRAGVRKALFRTRSYEGLIGKVAITPAGASTLARVAIFQVRNGSFRLERTLDLSAS
jgi:branched-chain amino acid transport system substrate-binding protein